MSIKCLSHNGQSNREIVRLLQLSEGKFHYQRRREREEAVDSRGRRRMPAENWVEVLAGDEVPATAIFDRLLRSSLVIDIEVRWNRPRDFERAVAQRGQKSKAFIQPVPELERSVATTKQLATEIQVMYWNSMLMKSPLISTDDSDINV
jgi:hypothetical protein